jgi:hypothetical protein
MNIVIKDADNPRGIKHRLMVNIANPERVPGLGRGYKDFKTTYTWDNLTFDQVRDLVGKIQNQRIQMPKLDSNGKQQYREVSYDRGQYKELVKEPIYVSMSLDLIFARWGRKIIVDNRTPNVRRPHNTHVR